MGIYTQLRPNQISALFSDLFEEHFGDSYKNLSKYDTISELLLGALSDAGIPNTDSEILTSEQRELLTKIKEAGSASLDFSSIHELENIRSIALFRLAQRLKDAKRNRDLHPCITRVATICLSEEMLGNYLQAQQFAYLWYLLATVSFLKYAEGNTNPRTKQCSDYRGYNAYHLIECMASVARIERRLQNRNGWSQLLRLIGTINAKAGPEISDQKLEHGEIPTHFSWLANPALFDQHSESALARLVFLL